MYRSPIRPRSRRQQNACRRVAHVYQVQTRIHIHWQFPVEKIYDDLARWGRLDVALPDGSARIDNDNRQPFPRHLPNDLFRQKFRAFVVPDHVGFGDGRLLVAGSAIMRDTQRADRTGINDLADARVPRNLQELSCAVHVGAIQFPRIFAPTGDSRRPHDTVYHIRASPGAGIGVRQITDRLLHKGCTQCPHVIETTVRAYQNADGFAPRRQLVRDMKSHKPCRSCYQRGHICEKAVGRSITA